MNKREKKYKQIIHIWKVLTNELFLFILNFVVLDLFLIVSQVYDLEWETHIFGALLTIFNLMLALVFLYKQTFTYYLFYYLSGAFIIVETLLKLVLNTHVLTLTFSIDYIIISVMIREFAKEKKIFFFAGYLVYFFIFANFDGLIIFDIRWVMIIPLIISGGLFIKFIKEIRQFFFVNPSKNQPRFRFRATNYKFVDFGVFLLTTLPLYWGFISNQCLQMTIFAAIFHVLYLFSMMLNETKIIFNGLTIPQQLYYRLSLNSFEKTKQPIPFKKNQKRWVRELCMKCVLRPASIVFDNCGHLTFCRFCWNKQRDRYQHCALCGEQVISYAFLGRSLGELVQKEVIESESELFNMYFKDRKEPQGQNEIENEENSYLSG